MKLWGGVHSLLVFGVEAVVHIVADVDKAPLVDAAVGFAQAVDPVAPPPGGGKAEAGLAGFDRSHRGFALACRDWCDHRFGIKGDTIEILLNSYPFSQIKVTEWLFCQIERPVSGAL